MKIHTQMSLGMYLSTRHYIRYTHTQDLSIIGGVVWNYLLPNVMQFFLIECVQKGPSIIQK